MSEIVKCNRCEKRLAEKSSCSVSFTTNLSESGSKFDGQVEVTVYSESTDGFDLCNPCMVDLLKQAIKTLVDESEKHTR